jgi:hypothetical protein
MFQLFYSIVISQEKVTTEYENDKYSKINLSLNGQVKSLTVIIENLVTENNEEIEYYFDESGFPTKIVENSLGFDVMARDLRKENTVFTFENGKLVSELNQINEGLDGYTYKFDNAGNVIQKRFYVKNRVVSQEIYEYDDNNRKVKFIDYVFGYFRDYSDDLPPNKDEFIQEYKIYEYDEFGNLIEENEYDNIRKEIYEKTIYTYDDKGNLIEEGSCKPYIDRYSKKEKCDYKGLEGYKFNKKNQMIKKYKIGNWSPHNTDTYYKYGKDGRETEAKGFYITKKDTVLGYHYITEYDENGNKTKEEEIVGRYRSIGFDKYKTESLEYDKFQNIILQEFITSNGQRIKVVKYNYAYDNKGNWIERQKLEGKTSSDLKLTEKNTRKIEYYN